MRHPTILPGRQGLPPTSNVPWSAFEEKHARIAVVFFFIMFWAGIVMAVTGLWLHIWRSAIAFVLFSVVMLWFLRIYRLHLYAMLMNKPRDTSALTHWIEHPWTGTELEGREYFCRCGRLVELWKAKYFKDSRRYSMVCECGIGHFQMDPRPHVFKGKR